MSQEGALPASAGKFNWQWRPLLLTAFFCGAWAILEITIGLRVQGSYDLLQVVWSRYAVHLVLVLAIWGRRLPVSLLRTKRPAYHLTRSLMMLVMPWSFAAALQSGVLPSTAWMLFWCSPLLAMLLGAVLWQEIPPRWAWLTTALGWAGVGVIVAPSLPATSAGWVLPLVMAASFAIYVVMTRSLRDEPLGVNMAYTALGVFAVLSVRMPFVWITPTLHDAVLFVCVGSLGLLALLSLDRALASSPTWMCVGIMSLQVVFEAVLMEIENSHLPTARMFSGMLIIATAVLALYVLSARLQRAAASPG